MRRETFAEAARGISATAMTAQNSDLTPASPASPASSAAAGGCFDVAGFIARRVTEHQQWLGDRLARLRELAADAAAVNSSIPDMAEMDQTVAFLCNDLRECLEREESMVFPALLRLKEQTSVSKCHAGMIKARLRFMVAEQEAIAGSLASAADIVRLHLSPTGPCETCHELLIALESLQAELSDHLRREQDELFAWALAREEALVRQIAD
jgi:regulator of cell morphogenesis and NO signaling